MSKVAVVYWSGTGNTQSMADAVVAGINGKGGEAVLLTAAEFDSGMIDSFDAIAFGCPSMGSEQLEESEFEPMYQDLRGSLSGKPVGLFGSYGWGDGEWIRTWAEDAEAAGARMVVEPVMANGSPDGDAETACAALGTALANA